MNKFTHFSQLLSYLFDDSKTIKKAEEILTGILKARSARLSDIACEMAGGEARNYKCLQRFLDETQPQEVLLRMFQETAPFVIGDPTEMPRPQAKKTEYVGTLSDGQTSGYWLLFLATPYRGRAIPCQKVVFGTPELLNTLPANNLCGNHLIKSYLGQAVRDSFLSGVLY